VVHPSEESYGVLAGASPELVERARAVARGFLLVLAPGGGADPESVLMVVSELVTNAVQHAGGMTGFGLEAGAGTVTVTVEDASRIPPQVLPPDPARPGGFGWPLVQALAQDVYVSVGSGGKTVSAVMPLPH
jgi:anti-sigma regulatory factor (Ser/Thr protein kinase)